MNHSQLGAHEVLELHEILCHSINGINQFLLYEPHIRDERLRDIFFHQMNFMKEEYNQLVSMMDLSSSGKSKSYKVFSAFEPRYGLDQPPQSYPKVYTHQLLDSDIASGMLGYHKSSAVVKMTASLEFANLSLRNVIIQSAKNCADQAYEIFQYMNERGLYQVPILTNQEAVLHQYQEALDPTLFNKGIQL